MADKYILVGIDGSEITQHLLQYAAWLSDSNELPIKIVHTIEHSHTSEQAHHEGNLTPNIRDELLKELTEEERAKSKSLIAQGKELIGSAKSQLEALGIKNVITQLRHGTLPEAIADFENETAFVMLGSKGMDHKEDKEGLGYHLEYSIKATSTPVFIAKRKFVKPKKVMFAFNGSPTSKKALTMITKDTIYKGELEIHAVCVDSDQNKAESLAKEAENILKASKDTIITRAMTGDPLEQLVQYQIDNQIDITAMGAYSHGKLHGFFFGSFTTKMIQQSDTNFLLIR